MYETGTDTCGLDDEDNADALICRLCCVVEDDFVEELLDTDPQPQQSFFGAMAIATDAPSPTSLPPEAKRSRRRYTKGKPRKYSKVKQIAAELWHQRLNHVGIEKLKHTTNCTTGMG